MARIATYHRVSTDDQSLERQRDATSTYVQDRLDTPLDSIEFYETNQLEETPTGKATSISWPMSRTEILTSLW